MGKDRKAGVGVSSAEVWDRLEELVREQAQAFVQRILEEEVTEFLARRKSERKAGVDGVAGYRNGYGKPSVHGHPILRSWGTPTYESPVLAGT